MEIYFRPLTRFLGMPKIYLDTCVWGRPFDKPTPRIKEEAEAFYKILRKVDRREVSIVASGVLEEEIEEIKDESKRELVKSLVSYSTKERLGYVPDKYKELMKHGLKIPDAAHVACALELKVEYFISVDKRLLNKGKKIKETHRIILCSPGEFLELEGE
jgi:predicted nucleic acid-binding protein